MPNIPVEVAIERAREALALGRETPARAVFVTRLDLSERAYHLVTFNAGQADGGIAAVDARTGEVLTHARISGVGEQPFLDAVEASRRAGVSVGSLKLVWRPCRISFSMLSPFWEVSTGEGKIYLDRLGNRWTELDVSARGGD